MKFPVLAASLLSSASFISVLETVTERATYDNTYDNASGSMLSVACSNTEFGLADRFATFGALPTFPNIGGTAFIFSSLSDYCGSCWSINAVGLDTAVFFTAIDVASEGFNISEESMLTIANNTAIENGFAEIQAVQVDAIYCGL
ncbi:hypothetical protein M0805_002186 [Coniferiporia weirii]|nr:hypothetical protein M0805_002186 [Coniferiporia weirii]